MSRSESASARVDSGLLSRVWGEYQEMPGLQLTLAQACRLWSTDAPRVQEALELLVARELLRKSGLAYVRADSGRLSV